MKFSAVHKHDPEDERIEEARLKGTLTLKTLGEAAKEYDDKMTMKIEMV